MFNKNENIVFSPYALRVLLSVLYQISSGSTQSELCDRVRLVDKPEMLAIQKRSISRFAASPNVNLVNKVYITNESHPTSTFSSILRDLGSSVEQVDFTKSLEVAETMNKWVESETNGLIKNLVSPSSIDSETSLFLLNTLYFKAKWLDPFPEQSTYKGTFFGYDGVNYQTDFMSQWNEYKMATAIDSEILEIPYEAGSNFVIWMILPNENHEIGEITQKLDRQLITNIDAAFEKTDAIVMLPLFVTEMDIDGKTLLTNLGIKSMFQNGELDMLEDHPPMIVDEVRQKVKIIVNSDGTEAASGTCKFFFYHYLRGTSN